MYSEKNVCGSDLQNRESCKEGRAFKSPMSLEISWCPGEDRDDPEACNVAFRAVWALVGMWPEAATSIRTIPSLLLASATSQGSIVLPLFEFRNANRQRVKPVCLDVLVGHSIISAGHSLAHFHSPCATVFEGKVQEGRGNLVNSNKA